MPAYIYRLFIIILCSIYLHLGFASTCTAQLVTTEPAFPLQNEALNIIFNAAEGSGGLNNYNGTIYAHTGVITSSSTQPSDWKYVKTNWGQNTPETALQNLGNNKWLLNIQPNIRDYYGVPSDEEILKIAIVFRSGEPINGNYLEGKTATGGDIFIDIATLNLQVNFNNPNTSFYLMNLGETLNVEAVSLLATTTTLHLNNQVVAEATNNQAINYPFTPTTGGNYTFVATATDGSTTVSDTLQTFVTPPVNELLLPNSLSNGINEIIPDSVVFVLYAPNKSSVFVLGTFNNFTPNQSAYMNRSPDGDYWWLGVGNLQPGQQYIYQYLIDGSIRIGDPYATKIVDPYSDPYIPSDVYSNYPTYPSNLTNDLASVLQTNQPEYNWQVNNFVPPPKENLVIYEMLIRDFTEAGTYQAAIDTLNYLADLGVNAIELMPIMEFENNVSWGYNPSYFFAADKYYGGNEGLKAFVDACHAKGIAVILDIVVNHAFGQSPLVRMYFNQNTGQPSADSPYFNQVPKHDFNVGYDFNHESTATRQYFNDVLTHWINNFKIDGYRFDLSKGLTQVNTLGNLDAWAALDPSRVAILQAYRDVVLQANPNAYLILEHLAGNEEETLLANDGFLMWGNMNHNFNQATMGFNSNSNFQWASYQERNWNQPNLIAYMESHDEERLMFRNLQFGNSAGTYNIQEEKTAIERVAMAANFYFAIPGPKMIWQFGELAYDISIDYNGRTGPKPVLWQYYYEPTRKRLYDIYKTLIHLKTTEPAFNTTNFELNTYGLRKTITLNHPDMNVFVVGNFGMIPGSFNIDFPSTGTWYELWSGDSLQVNTPTQGIALGLGSYKFYTTKKLSLPNVQPVVGIEPISTPLPAANTISIYPQPAAASQKINVYFNYQSETSNIATVSIYNMQGKQIYSESGVLAAQQNGYVWSVATPPQAGMYICKVQLGNKLLNSKFVVQ